MSEKISPISPMERPYKRTVLGKVTVEIQGNTVDLWVRDWNGESLGTVDRSELLAALEATGGTHANESEVQRLERELAHDDFHGGSWQERCMDPNCSYRVRG